MHTGEYVPTHAPNGPDPAQLRFYEPGGIGEEWSLVYNLAAARDGYGGATGGPAAHVALAARGGGGCAVDRAAARVTVLVDMGRGSGHGHARAGAEER
ncbi:hypothetical protein H4F94_00200, partial [Streptomyces sp. SP18CM02]|nr:hypothetical protein [Streptomyces sp. SP18CM02]